MELNLSNFFYLNLDSQSQLPTFSFYLSTLNKFKSFSISKKKLPSFITHCAASLKPRWDLRSHIRNPPFPDTPLPSQIDNLFTLKRYKEALELFEIIQSTAYSHPLPAPTYICLLSSCAVLRAPWTAKAVFRQMVDSGFEFDLPMEIQVLSMFLKCGLVDDARFVFGEMADRDAVSWNMMIDGLFRLGFAKEAFALWLEMWEEEGMTGKGLVIAIRGSVAMRSAVVGRQLHSVAVKLGLFGNVYVGCTLINMYSKYGEIEEAESVWDEMPEKNVVGWNSIIEGFSINGCNEKALDLFYEMQKCGVKMDNFTYATVISTCARLGYLELVKEVHAGLLRNGFQGNVFVNTALIDFYGKWGRMEDARNVFDRMRSRNLETWNALIDGYGIHGMGVEAVAMFERLVAAKGLAPNHVTFRAVLDACSSSGLYSKGVEIFESMKRKHRVKPSAMHYACMIKLLGREGLLDEALDLIENGPFPPTTNMWAALLAACRFHRYFELGKFAAEKLYYMEPEKLSNYKVLLNLYAGSGRMEDAANVVKALNRKGLKLVPAFSWIEIKKQAHKFVFGDKYHQKSSEARKKLDEIMKVIGEGDCGSRGKYFLPDVEEDDLSEGYHSELLAIAFGLISTMSFTPLQVMQAHRICEDCHNVIKKMTMVTKREIVVRDSERYHHFVRGVCSCGYYQ